MSLEIEQDSHLRFACAGIEIEALHWWQRIVPRLEDCLGDQITDDQAYAAAILIFNPFGATGPSWKDLEKGYGVGRSRDSIDMLQRTRAKFEAVLADEEAGSIEKEEMRDLVRQRIFDYAQPIWSTIKDARYGGDVALFQMLDYACRYFEHYLAEQSSVGGNYKALRIALSLLAIFEEYTDLPISGGDDEKGNPTSAFGTTLEAVFEECGVKAGFRHFAEKAKKEANIHAQDIEEMKKNLRSVLEVIRQNQEIKSFPVIALRQT